MTPPLPIWNIRGIQILINKEKIIDLLLLTDKKISLLPKIPDNYIIYQNFHIRKTSNPNKQSLNGKMVQPR